MNAQAQQQTPLETMLVLLNGHCVEQALHVVASLGIADRLSDGPQSSDVLADGADVDRQSLRRLLKMLSSIGVFSEVDGKFLLTELGSTLRTDVQNSVRDRAMFYGSQEMWKVWGHLMQSVKTGRSAFEHAHGTNFYDFLASHPAVGGPFNRYMSKSSEQHIPALLEAYDFSKFREIADVGGGHGRTLAAILQTYRQLKGVLFDMPSVIRDAAALDDIETTRVRREAGDMCKTVPKGCDAYLLKWVLMDRTDEEVVATFNSCRGAMTAGAEIIVVEMLVPEATPPTFPALLDIQMMLLYGRARLRTETEFRLLFEAAGITLAGCIPTRSPNSILAGNVC